MSPTQTTVLLNALGSGDRGAADELVPALYEELRALAAAQMRRGQPDNLLQTTAVVHEAYLRLVDQRTLSELGRREFLALVAEVVRRVLVDHARAARTGKRGGGWKPVTLHESAAVVDGRFLDVLSVDEALAELAALEPRHARLVELRFFAGLAHRDVADILGVSLSTVEKDWRFVRSWLRTRLSENDGLDEQPSPGGFRSRHPE